MNPLKIPLNEMRFLLEHVFNADSLWQSLPALSESVDTDTALAILDEAARLNTELVHPLNRPGDEEGATFAAGQVSTPGNYKQAYQAFMEGGWLGLCGEPEFGGMGMPKMLGVLVDEMGYSASNAFTLYGSLTAGAALAINAHGSDELKAAYLPKLYSGEWAGAMDMTEPQAGSDLRNIRTRAESQDDGSFLISGSKIFITGGDQDLTTNVVHLVLAKTTGSTNLSLFLVPKYLPDASGNAGTANGVTVGSIEHKMGLKGSATCVMNYDNARGWLIGRENRGLACMFTMMNYERLAIGIQGLGSAQAAVQMATDYAKERLQGTAPGSGNDSDAIIVHGDVRRMLLTIRTLTDAGRVLAMETGKQLDLSKYSDDASVQEKASRFAGLLTPVAKAFLTDRGLDITVMAQQVFGGHGYIRETGIEQLVRDTRIAQIYEGTNGIQAIDFLGRKLCSDKLVTLNEFIDYTLSPLQGDDANLALLRQGFSRFVDVAAWINDNKLERPALINASAVEMLDAFGYLLYGAFHLRMVQAAAAEDSAFAIAKAQFSDFYFAKVLPRADALLNQVRAGDAVVMNIDEALF